MTSRLVRFSLSEPKGAGFFEMCEHVVMFAFPESTPYTVDVFSFNMETVRMGRKIDAGMKGR